MRIHCPFCGDRDASEFAYLGAATQPRPKPSGPDHEKEFFEAIYIRDNPAGPHEELWYHAHGCYSWLRVTRDTRTHEIFSVEFASTPRSSSSLPPMPLTPTLSPEGRGGKTWSPNGPSGSATS